MANEPLPLAFLVARLLFSLTLVFATYNPTGYSFFHWITYPGAALPSLKAIVAVALVMIYYAMFRVVFGALRRSGIIMGGLAALLFATELARIVAGWRSHPSWNFYVVLAQYVTLCGIAIVIALGVSWSHLIERLTGQLQKRYVRR